MKYHYFYQTHENKSLDGWIAAKDRNDAYAQLKKQGIKPYKVEGRNPIAWKRWATIGVLAIVVAVLSVKLATTKALAEAWEEPRAQLYGDPATIQKLAAEGWRRTFGEADAWFARHAIPAGTCDCPAAKVALSTVPVGIGDEDAPELKKMKRMVNGMKAEMAAYLTGDNTIAEYMALCDERLSLERGQVAIYNQKFDALRKRGGDVEVEWERLNDELRDMGLPTQPLPLDE